MNALVRMRTALALMLATVFAVSSSAASGLPPDAVEVFESLGFTVTDDGGIFPPGVDPMAPTPEPVEPPAPIEPVDPIQQLIDLGILPSEVLGPPSPPVDAEPPVEPVPAPTPPEDPPVDPEDPITFLISLGILPPDSGGPADPIVTPPMDAEPVDPDPIDLAAILGFDPFAPTEPTSPTPPTAPFVEQESAAWWEGLGLPPELLEILVPESVNLAASAGQAAVPEPSAGALLLAAGLSVTGRSRRP